jgi:hypothetical protein
MEKVIRHVNEMFKHAGNSKEVKSQKEELITDLHDKILDLMSQGKSEDEAFQDAITSMDGLEELTEVLSGKHRTIYINRLKFRHSLMTFGLITLEIVACGAFYLFGWLTLPDGQQSYMDMPYFDMHTVIITFVGLGIALLATAIFPIVRGLIYKKNPEKVIHVEFDFSKKMMVAVIGWIAVLLGLTIINIAPIEKDAGPVIWFQWPIIAISNLPISIIIYNMLYKSKRYSAK